MNQPTVKEFDCFYTKPTVAAQCYKLVREVLEPYLDETTLWVEPSAGCGSFFDLIDGHKVGFDIRPMKEGIQKFDFLGESTLENWLFSQSFLGRGNWTRLLNNSVILGNPPFGRRSSKAVAFFNRAATFSHTVAFILPNQFKRYSTQSKLDASFRLIRQVDLEENSFFVGQRDYRIRCVFQVWTRLKTPHDDLRLREKPPVRHPDFDLFQYNHTKMALKYFDKKRYGWHFAVPRQGFYDYRRRVENELELNPKIQWIFFKAHSPLVLERLKGLDLEALSKSNTLVLGFGKHDVVREYTRCYPSIRRFQ